MNLTFVRWIDSIRHMDGWHPVEHYQREATARTLNCETVGWLIHEDDQSVMVAQSKMANEDGAVTEVIQIPKVAITSRHPLKEPLPDAPKKPKDYKPAEASKEMP